MLWRQDVLKTVGVREEEGLRLFGNVRRMIVPDDSDGALRGYLACRSDRRPMNSTPAVASSTRAVIWPSWRSSAARIEQVPSRSYSWSRLILEMLAGHRRQVVPSNPLQPDLSLWAHRAKTDCFGGALGV
jgi:hypothetical protein